MTEQQDLVGPLSEGKWGNFDKREGDLQSLPLLIIPDAANEILKAQKRPLVYYYIPKTPSIVKSLVGDPVFSLTIILNEKQYQLNEISAPLIKMGMFTSEFNLSTNFEVTKKILNQGEMKYIPLVSSEIIFELILEQNGTEKSLGTTRISDINSKASLSATLSGIETIHVLSALKGMMSNMKIRTKVSYSATQLQHFRLYGSWRKVYDFLRENLNLEQMVTSNELRKWFEEMLRVEVLSYEYFTNQDGEINQEVKSALFNEFIKLASGVIIGKENTDKARYFLKEKFYENISLDYQQKQILA
ncbi:hypothetical protein, partial [Priestia megaterium]|uniref:hypothetical protein n=1 Tax=Priestia megaterium TaxID=1404 RepID=UPI003008EE4A